MEEGAKVMNGNLVLDGINDYVLDGGKLDLSSEKLTISLWVYPEVNKRQYIIAKAGHAGYDRDYSVILNREKKIEFEFGNDATESVNLISESAINVDSWVYVSFEVSGQVVEDSWEFEVV